MSSFIFNSRRIIGLSLVALLAAATIPLMSPHPGAFAQQERKQKQAEPQKPPKKVDDDQTIKLDTKLVNVLFSVQDKQNRYVNDIGREHVEPKMITIKHNMHQDIHQNNDHNADHPIRTRAQTTTNNNKNTNK
jgi:hypothetical protein